MIDVCAVVQVKGSSTRMTKGRGGFPLPREPMADRLSQLQTCLDQLVTQFYSSLNYINKHHDLSVPEGAPSYAAKAEDPQLEIVPTEQFGAALTELSHDIVTKAKQIETLINSLPELETATSDNLEGLELQLQAARAEEAAAAVEREVLLRQCDELVMRVTEYKRELDKQTR